MYSTGRYRFPIILSSYTLDPTVTRVVRMDNRPRFGTSLISGVVADPADRCMGNWRVCSHELKMLSALWCSSEKTDYGPTSIDQLKGGVQQEQN